MKYAEINLGQVEAIINKLGGEQGALRLLRGELVVSAAKPVEIRVWKTVRLGICKTDSEYLKAIEKADMRVSRWGGEILTGVVCCREETDLDLVILSVGDLGFVSSARYYSICDKAIELGLKICPAEVGPALRLQYGNQPNDERLHIAMEAIHSFENCLNTFCLTRNSDGLWLDGLNSRPYDLWGVDCRLVFALRK